VEAVAAKDCTTLDRRGCIGLGRKSKIIIEKKRQPGEEVLTILTRTRSIACPSLYCIKHEQVSGCPLKHKPTLIEIRTDNALQEIPQTSEMDHASLLWIVILNARHVKGEAFRMEDMYSFTSRFVMFLFQNGDKVSASCFPHVDKMNMSSIGFVTKTLKVVVQAILASEWHHCINHRLISQ
jgi:hypothetical protein